MLRRSRTIRLKSEKGVSDEKFKPGKLHQLANFSVSVVGLSRILSRNIYT